MDKRRAKRIACKLAARVVDGALDSGWEVWHELLVEKDSPDRWRLEEALEEVIAELHCRGEAPPADNDREAYKRAIGESIREWMEP